jgi:hypothetical protein
MMIAGLMMMTGAQAQPGGAALSSAAIRQILADRIDTMHQGVGIVVGVIDPTGRRIVSYGRIDQDNSKALDGDTIFGHAITLVDLATHTSGLPRLPTNLRPSDPQDPYVDYRPRSSRRRRPTTK